MNKMDKSVILLVDDKPANLLALENLLAGNDRLFIKAADGKEALKIVLNKTIDLIILDVQMPDMDGFEVANILKSNKRTKDIPIIFVSAEKKEHQFMMKGFEEGGIDYLYKPLDSEIAIAKVSVFLKNQLQKKELLEKNNALQKSALLINNSADIIGIIDATTFTIEDINNAFTNIAGFNQKEALGTSLTFYLSNEDRALINALSKKKDEQLSFETRIYCKDRSMKWLHWKVVVKDGKWFVNARDITEVKEVEKIRNYLATVVKQSNDAIYIHDHEGKIISWNEGAEKVYGYTEKEALKMKIRNIIPEYMQLESGELVNKIVSGEKVQGLESKRITKHGKLIDVLFSANIITDSSNEQKSIAITERDITQQKLADEQIRQLNADLQKNIEQLESVNKELESFSYSVSHDLRAPLRAVDGYSQILEEDYSQILDPEAQRLLANIRTNSKKMSTLIDDLLAFSRLGKREIQKSMVDMKQLVQEVLNDTQDLITPAIEVQVKSVIEANADRALVRQVWINLISNALKYSSKKEHPIIEIGSHLKANEIIYYVKDNGAGFSMDFAHKLFNVFQRLHADTEFEGTGIGLAIVHRIIKKHNGIVWAEGIPGKGATFYFSLPVSS